MEGRLRFRLLILATLFVLPSLPAIAEKRVALVIGNSAYTHVGLLPNTPRDATAMADLLTQAKFDSVDLKTDVTVSALRAAVRDFAQKAQDADIAVIYYAGHGIEVDGVNYLIPVDAALKTDVDVEDETVSLDRLLRVLEPVKRLRLVILDACRDNPFARTMARSVRTRSIGRGLAKVEPETTNTLIAFAARAGSTASDGAGTNSPFTEALVANIAEPGVDLRLAFGKVRDDVMRSTANRQEPFTYGSLGGATVALVSKPEADVVKSAISSPGEASAQAGRDYSLAEKVGTVAAWDSFLVTYKTGFYADLARAQRAKLASVNTKQDTGARGASAKTEPFKTEPSSAKSKSLPKNAAGQPAEGSLSPGQRLVIQSDTCPAGQMLEIIGGSRSKGISRQQRCIPAN
jgi:hypothetical protein